MRDLLVFFATIIMIYGCSDTSAKENKKNKEEDPAHQSLLYNHSSPPEALRVRKDEAMKMRSRRLGNDTAVVKISAEALRSLMDNNPDPNGDYIFYFVKYSKDSPNDKRRYLTKFPNANWDKIKDRSSLLVGYMGRGQQHSNLVGRHLADQKVALYDMSEVCPPPPNCECEIAQ